MKRMLYKLEMVKIVGKRGLPVSLGDHDFIIYQPTTVGSDDLISTHLMALGKSHNPERPSLAHPPSPHCPCLKIVCAQLMRVNKLRCHNDG